MMAKRAKKILIVHSSNDLYGASRIVVQVTDILIAAGHEVHVILPYYGELDELFLSRGVPCSVYNLGVFRKKYMNPKGLYNRFVKIRKAKKYLSNYIQKHQIDLLYTSTSVIIAGALAAKKNKIPNIYHVHEIPSGSKLYATFIGLFLKYYTDKVMVVSNSVKQHWATYMNSSKIVKIYNGIVFKASTIQNSTNTLNNKPTNIISVGRLMPLKGHRYFIEVARELLKRNENYQFWIVGDTFAGYEPYEKELKILVANYKLENNIHFLGYRKDVNELLAKADLFFHHSVAPDSLPTVLFEAMKSKVPAVATNLGGAIEILDNGNCGLLVPHNKAVQAAQSIDDYLKDKNLQQLHTEKAIKHIDQFFSTAKFEENILAEFENTAF